MRTLYVLLINLILYSAATAQIKDTIPVTAVDTTIVATQPEIRDTSLRIINLSPFFNSHVDSAFSYQFRINKEPSQYYWFFKNAPAGLNLERDKGTLTFKGDKKYFLSGRLRYDYPYKVNIGVQNLSDPFDRVDTSFTILFYNTEIIPSRVKPSVGNSLTIEEGETVSFRVQCETGNFPIRDIIFSSSIPIENYSPVRSCDDTFTWTPPFDFVKETDSARVKIVNLTFTGSDKFNTKDTANIRLIVRNALNYPQANQEFDQLHKNVETYILQLKYAFLQLDRKLKRVKTSRTIFDLTAGTTALTGSILNSSSNSNTQKAGKIMPGIGVSLVPVKEAVAPSKGVEQNQASQLRTSIKRLEYMVRDNERVGEKDPDILKKTARLKEELKQSQIQLIDIPVDFITTEMSAEELNDYFNSPKVNKKYRLKRK